MCCMHDIRKEHMLFRLRWPKIQNEITAAAVATITQERDGDINNRALECCPVQTYIAKFEYFEANLDTFGISGHVEYWAPLTD